MYCNSQLLNTNHKIMDAFRNLVNSNFLLLLSNQMMYIQTIRNKLNRLETNLFLTILVWAYKLEIKSKTGMMELSNLISSTENNFSNDSIT